MKWLWSAWKSSREKKPIIWAAWRVDDDIQSPERDPLQRPTAHGACERMADCEREIGKLALGWPGEVVRLGDELAGVFHNGGCDRRDQEVLLFAAQHKFFRSVHKTNRPKNPWRWALWMADRCAAELTREPFPTPKAWGATATEEAAREHAANWAGAEQVIEDIGPEWACAWQKAHAGLDPWLSWEAGREKRREEWRRESEATRARWAEETAAEEAEEAANGGRRKSPDPVTTRAAQEALRALGLSNKATPEQVKTAYRRLAREHHPDRGGDRAQFEAIQAAYKTALAVATQGPAERKAA